jgi:hypothetical protein
MQDSENYIGRGLLDIIQSKSYLDLPVKCFGIIAEGVNPTGEQAYRLNIFIKYFMDDDYRFIQSFEDTKFFDISNDGKIILTLNTEGNIQIFRRYINREILEIKYKQDNTFVYNHPAAKFIYSVDNQVFITASNNIIRLWNLNSGLFNDINVDYGNMSSLQIANYDNNNNIFVSFSRINLEEVEDEIMYENTIQVYNFGGNQRFSLNWTEDIGVIAADCSNDTGVYTYLSSDNNNFLQLNIEIENLEGDHVHQVIYESDTDNTDNFGGKLIISRNGRTIVCIINNILHIWTLDIDQELLEFHDFTVPFNLQRIILNHTINTFCITDDMKILCARSTPEGNDIMIFERNILGRYENIPIIPNLNINIDYFANRYTNIKSISYSSQMLFNIARTEDRYKRTHKNKFTPTLENIKTRMRDGRRSKSRRRRSKSGRKKRSKSGRKKRSKSGRKKRSKSGRKKRSKSGRKKRSKSGRRSK